VSKPATGPSAAERIAEPAVAVDPTAAGALAEAVPSEEPRGEAVTSGVMPGEALRPELAAPASAPRARLESVVMIGDTHRATFRVAGDSVTLVEGDWLGQQQIAGIGTRSVTLVGRAGGTRTVPLGQDTAIE
jgi:hypothetical protein